MRNWIDLASVLSEQIVHKDQFIEPYNTKKTIVAINPSRSEWRANFPNGAAGVFCRDGRIVVGDGNCLDHSTILDLAGVPQRQELCRLQIHNSNGLYAELWIPEEYEKEEDHAKIIQYLETKVGSTLPELEAKLAAVVRPFMGDVPVKAVPMWYTQEPMLPDHKAFRANLWPPRNPQTF